MFYSRVARNLLGSREKKCGDDGDDLNTAVGISLPRWSGNAVIITALIHTLIWKLVDICPLPSMTSRKLSFTSLIFSRAFRLGALDIMIMDSKEETPSLSFSNSASTSLSSVRAYIHIIHPKQHSHKRTTAVSDSLVSCFHLKAPVQCWIIKHHLCLSFINVQSADALRFWVQLQ